MTTMPAVVPTAWPVPDAAAAGLCWWCVPGGLDWSALALTASEESGVDVTAATSQGSSEEEKK